MDNDMKLFSNKDEDCNDSDRETNPKMPSQQVVEEFESESCYGEGKATLSVIVQGASGDLAKKMTFPALFSIYTPTVSFLPTQSLSAMFGVTYQTTI